MLEQFVLGDAILVGHSPVRDPTRPPPNFNLKLQLLFRRLWNYAGKWNQFLSALCRTYVSFDAFCKKILQLEAVSCIEKPFVVAIVHFVQGEKGTEAQS